MSALSGINGLRCVFPSRHGSEDAEMHTMKALAEAVDSCRLEGKGKPERLTTTTQSGHIARLDRTGLQGATTTLAPHTHEHILGDV